MYIYYSSNNKDYFTSKECLQYKGYVKVYLTINAEHFLNVLRKLKYKEKIL